MTKNDVIGLLEGGVPPDKVAEAAQQEGIAFEMTAGTEAQLRDVGADDTLIVLLKRIAPKGGGTTRPKPTPAVTGPAVLMVEVAPGGAQVYVDDEPVGTTSQSGRLKLSQLQPGAHSVRVSLAGYNELEQSVELTAGETTMVRTTLAKVPARGGQNPLPQNGGSANPLAGGGGGANPLAGTGTSNPITSAEPGSIGVIVAQQTPQGGQGAYITAVAPGGPAEQAGLRPGHTILAMNGYPVNVPQTLLDLLNRTRPGDSVDIAYSDGSRVQQTRAHLVARSNLAPPPAQNPSPAPAIIPGGATNPAAFPQRNLQPSTPPVSFNAMHDHGQSGQDFCSGVLTVGGGRLTYRGNNSAHALDLGLDEIKEAKKNGVYLALIGGFHVRLKNGPNYNFVVINSAGQYQPPTEFLRAIGVSMGKN